MFEHKSEMSYQSLLKSCEQKPKNIPNTPYFYYKQSSFLFMNHEDFTPTTSDTTEILTKAQNESALYTGHKIHINLAGNNENIAKCWDALVNLLVGKGIKQFKVVIPELVEKTFEENLTVAKQQASEESIKIATADRDRRLNSTQMTLYIYQSSSNKEIDYELYISLLKEIDAILTKANITPLEPSKTPQGDTQIGKFTSIRQDRNEHGKTINYDETKNFEVSKIINNFINYFSSKELPKTILPDNNVEIKKPSITLSPLLSKMLIAALKVSVINKDFWSEKEAVTPFFLNKLDAINAILEKKDLPLENKFEQIYKLSQTSIEEVEHSSQLFSTSLPAKAKEFFTNLRALASEPKKTMDYLMNISTEITTYRREKNTPQTNGLK